MEGKFECQKCGKNNRFMGGNTKEEALNKAKKNYGWFYRYTKEGGLSYYYLKGGDVWRFGPSNEKYVACKCSFVSDNFDIFVKK